MDNNHPFPRTQENFSRANDHALATPLERAASELGTSPFWLRRALAQRGLSIKAFVATNQFRALCEKRAAADARAQAVMHQGPKPKRLAATNGQSAPQPARRRTNGVTPAAAAAVPDRKTIGSPAPTDDISQPRQVAHG
jgi:hypothetical protein